MKAKIFLIIMMILFAVSCANNNPANPVQNNNEAKNTENNANSGNTSSNSGNTSSNDNGSDNEGTGINNNGDKPTIEALNGIVEYKEYKGKAQLTTKGLDGRPLTDPEDIGNIYVDIYEKEKAALVQVNGIFSFKDIKLDNAKHTYYSSNEKGDYILTMTVRDDSITDFQIIIYFKGDNYRYYVTSAKLEKL
ncbi:hypothetical protein R4J03_05545 [Brachyspira intermedia]|uniref:hypothetical protein n=1 Tax=Brachyspira intermedia TaxID=84377 RepID=UPI00261D3BCE|nr:hypothetical protein [uncultured Brachyspira sp.]